MATHIITKLEVCYANTDGSAWYAYFDGDPTCEEIEAAQANRAKRESCNLGLVPDGPEDVSDALSQYTGLHRIYIGSAS